MNQNSLSAENQIVFLTKIQNLFDNSTFNSTYKFALLITLTDLAIEYGDNLGAPLFLDSKLIATRFAELYWPQIREFSPGIFGTVPGVLRQNNGEQAAIISTLISIQKETGLDDFSKITKEKIWQTSLNKIITTIWGNPVFYLQEDSDQFIFSFSKDKSGLTLTSDAAFCFRKFNQYVIQFARQGWVNQIKSNKNNIETIGPKDDLESFLFGSNRANLTKLNDYLLKYQDKKCFYCQKPISKLTDVDHFIPWRKYPRNIAENLILCCQSCNRSKSDSLASIDHLRKWLDTVLINKERSQSIAEEGFISDKDCCLKVASWAYENALTSNSNAWLGVNKYEVINDSYLNLLADLRLKRKFLITNKNHICS